MNSMTGFGMANFCLPNSKIEIEVSSVNKRYLEVLVSAPKEWQRFEFDARIILKSLFERGRIRIAINISKNSEIENSSLFEEPLIKKDLAQLESFLKNEKVSFKPDANIILRLTELRKNQTSLPPLEQIFDKLENTLTKACNKMDEMRTIEGSKIKEDFKKRIDIVEGCLLKLEKESTNASSEYQTKLLKRLNKLDLSIDIEDERILKEVALFAEKSDTTEEITRLKSHIYQIRKTLEVSGSIGRKIEFLLQEISRELNTYCSKSTMTNCTEIALEARNEVEKMREQSLNVE